MEKLFSPWRSKYISSFSDKEPSNQCVLCDAYHSSDDETNLIVYRGDSMFVLMNRFPYNSGHLMIIPVRHTSEFGSLTAQESIESMELLKISERALGELSRPQGFNIGMNLGRAAGAGIDGHLHWHIVPRWNGDTNFLPVLADVKVVSEAMQEQWKKLYEIFPRLASK
ncbi:MAG TPA: HIT domain-containing protein [Candidatus Kapabacteria bacterium]|nr:HIT domain-containing protein [Candidatus Kapabacteria bacterium]